MTRGCTSTYSDLADNLVELGLETHIQHAICLVQHQVRATLQVGLVDAQHVDQTPRGGNQNLNSAL